MIVSLFYKIEEGERVKPAKTVKITLKGNGLYLGMEKGCFVIKRRKKVLEKYPMFENLIGEIKVYSGNAISTGVLASCGFWDIPIMVLTRRGEPVAVLRSIDDYSHVKTRIAQYEAFKNEKGLEIAKQIVLSKIAGQNMVLEKHGLYPYNLDGIKARLENVKGEDWKTIRRKLTHIEGAPSREYFQQIFQLLPKSLRPHTRVSFKAYDGVNNTFNLAYTLLKFRVFQAVLRSHLEPFLGFIHAEAWGKPSLVCDLMEIYRYLIDNYVLDFLQNVSLNDFIAKKDWFSGGRLGKRYVLNEEKTEKFVNGLEAYFEIKVSVPRVRHGESQTIETLINEEATLLALFLRGDRKTWKPRLPPPP
ncbi:MAG: CRISPR-associated endonuclease Cas1 [Candidatus Bathyarchaeia archaeon]